MKKIPFFCPSIKSSIQRLGENHFRVTLHFTKSNKLTPIVFDAVWESLVKNYGIDVVSVNPQVSLTFETIDQRFEDFDWQNWKS